MRSKPIAKVLQDKEAPVEKPVLAEAILEISRAMKRLTASGLNSDAIVVLTADKVGYVGNRRPSKGDIRAVFNTLASLEHQFCR